MEPMHLPNPIRFLEGAFMSCKRCNSDARDFNGELVIHFPGLEGLNKPIVWVFPKLRVCLSCGLGEFVIPGNN